MYKFVGFIKKYNIQLTNVFSICYVLGIMLGIGDIKMIKIVFVFYNCKFYL